MERSTIIAMWVGGGAVGLMLVAMALTTLLRGCGGTSGEPPAGETQSDETAPGAPAESEPADDTAEPEADDAESTDAKADAGSRKQVAKQDRRKSSSEKPPRRPASDKQRRQTSGMAIRLSAGTALAQTLPTGAAIGVSVDYEFSRGQPASSAEYFLVIKPASGDSVKQPVKLDSQGTLQGFAQQLQPGNGPFRAYIEDASGNKLSDALALR